MSNRSLITIVSVVCATILFTFAFCPAYADTYAQPAIIVDIDIVEDLVILVDARGQEWAVYGADEFDIGDFVWVTFEDYNTEKLEDDEIIDMEFDGYVTRRIIMWWMGQ